MAKSKAKTKAKSAAKTNVKSKKPTSTAPKAKKVSAASSFKGFEKVTKTRTKSQIIKTLSEASGLSKKDVSNLFDVLSNLVGNDLSKGPGTFKIPGLVKVGVKKRPATKARKGRNPFTGEEIMLKAKPARNVVKIAALKALKEIV